MSLVASFQWSFVPSLRSGANDATRATNKLYARQKSCDCPIHAKGAIYLFGSWLEKKERISFRSPSEIMDLDVRSAFFFKSQLFVIKDLTVDALKNAFGELNLYLKKK